MFSHMALSCLVSVQWVGVSTLTISHQFKSFKERIRINLVEPYWFLLEPEHLKRGRDYPQSSQWNVSGLATIHKWNEQMMITVFTQMATLLISPVLSRSPRQPQIPMALR